MRFSRALTSIVVFAVDVAQAGVVVRDLVIRNVDLAPDGFSRPAVTAGGVFPAPLITGHKNDRFLLNVVDELRDSRMRRSTSIHWHGLFQAHSPEMDGPSFVNQCPIIPNHSFLYDFKANGQAGTYWYHSHLSTQYCDGLRGPLVIYDHKDPLRHLYDIDDASTVITLADWYHGLSTVLFTPTNKNTPLPDTTTINGLGRWSGATGKPGPLAVVRARHRKRHRFRIVSASCSPAYTFSIDQHKLMVIETDGVEILPITVDSVQVFAGQRYSAVVNADQPIDNYWIHAIPNVGNRTTVGGINSAIFRYDGAPHTEPNTIALTNVTLLNEANLVPLSSPGAPGKPVRGGADVNLHFRHSRDASGTTFMNGVSFVPPSVPILLQVLSGATEPGSILPNGSIYNLPPNKVIEVSFTGVGNHPFHLHGHNFDVVRVAGSTTYNYANPVRRDVVNTGGPDDNVTFRFVTDNPGPWFLHCHIDWHLEAGLAVVFAEDTKGIRKAKKPSPQWMNLCPLYDKHNPDKSFG